MSKINVIVRNIAWIGSVLLNSTVHNVELP